MAKRHEILSGQWSRFLFFFFKFYFVTRYGPLQSGPLHCFLLYKNQNTILEIKAEKF